MFGRRSQSDVQETEVAARPDRSAVDPAQAPKGRPTPSRKEAEAHRKQTMKAPADNKAAKRAMREREREERMTARAGLMAGDERYFPPRDRGPAKAFTRDYVDGKRRLSEYFLFLAIGVLLATFLQSPQAKNIASLVWFVIAGLVALDVIWVLFRLNGELKQRFPEKAERKGCLLYATLRLLQIRKLRIPPPRIRPGGAPVTPKQK